LRKGSRIIQELEGSASNVGKNNVSNTERERVSIQILSTSATFEDPSNSTVRLNVVVKNSGNSTYLVTLSMGELLNGLDALDKPMDRGIKGLVLYTLVYLPAGNYTFTSKGDEWGVLYIRGSEYKEWTEVYTYSKPDSCPSSPENPSKTVTVKGGWYEIVLDHFDKHSQGYLMLSANLPVPQITWFITSFYRNFIFQYEEACSTCDFIKRIVSRRGSPENPTTWDFSFDIYLRTDSPNPVITGQYVTKTSGNFNLTLSWANISKSLPPQVGTDSIIIGVLNPDTSNGRSPLLNLAYIGKTMKTDKIHIQVIGYEIKGTELIQSTILNATIQVSKKK